MFRIIALVTTMLTLAAQTPPTAAPAKPVRVAPPARITDFKAQPAAIKPGESTTLIWATENPNGVTIDPAPGRVTPRGSLQVTPKATTTYTLTVLGPNNTNAHQGRDGDRRGHHSGDEDGRSASVAKTVPRTPDGKPDPHGESTISAAAEAAAARAR